MAIVKMQRVAVVGLSSEKDEVMTQLMNLEAIQLTDQTAKLTEEEWAGKVIQDDGTEEAAAYDAEINRATQALEVISLYGGLKEGISLLKSRRAVDAVFAEHIHEKDEQAKQDIETILKINENIRKTNDRINKIDTDSLMLEAWKDYDVPLQETETLTTQMITGTVPNKIDFAEMQKEIESASDMVIYKKIGDIENHCNIALLVAKEDAPAEQEILKKYNFSSLNFVGFEGTASEIIEKNKIEREKLVTDLEGYKAEVAKLAPEVKERIENYSDMQTVETGKEKVKSRILKTDKAFFLEGWVPEPKMDAVKEVFDNHDCYYEFQVPDEEEAYEVPVLLKNNSFFTPIESVTEMYSLPKYGSFDPTSIYALFYICFFGMMFSDGCYGLIMAIVCGIVLKTCHLEGKMYKFVKGFFYCGISTIFWGAMFGGWFGDLVAVIGKTFFGAPADYVGIPPVWINPVEDPLTVLIFSLGLGIVHIFVAMGIRCYILIRQGKVFEAICEKGFWFLVIIGAILWLLPSAGSMMGGGAGSINIDGNIGKWIFIVGIVGLVVTGGRHSKGIGKVVGGLKEVYGITSYMSDILSYARVLALGLATGVIAQVVNTIGTLAGGGVKGVIILVIVFIIGTLLNFLINVLGAFVHSARLQFIEFFNHFYEDGGDAFTPFKRETQYIRIEDTAKN